MKLRAVARVGWSAVRSAKVDGLALDAGHQS
jgi:hypothetical protein